MLIRLRGLQVYSPHSQYAITLKMADQGWSDLHVVFTMILCGTNLVFGRVYQINTEEKTKLVFSSVFI